MFNKCTQMCLPFCSIYDPIYLNGNIHLVFVYRVAKSSSYVFLLHVDVFNVYMCVIHIHIDDSTIHIFKRVSCTWIGYWYIWYLLSVGLAVLSLYTYVGICNMQSITICIWCEVWSYYRFLLLLLIMCMGGNCLNGSKEEERLIWKEEY